MIITTMESTIYSIGHGTKSIDEFLKELRSFDIKYLIDVRSSPFSKWASQYNQNELKLQLGQSRITYVYMGDVIGGRPISDDCYDEEGFFDYKKMAQLPAFQEGLKRLVEANRQSIHIAVMCSESDPSQCHRSKLIGRELYAQYDIDMKHIINEGKYISEEQIIINLTNENWRPEGNLFGEVAIPYFKSVKSYKSTTIEEEEYYD